MIRHKLIILVYLRKVDRALHEEVLIVPVMDAFAKFKPNYASLLA